jgi:hypothetical protein
VCLCVKGGLYEKENQFNFGFDWSQKRPNPAHCCIPSIAAQSPDPGTGGNADSSGRGRLVCVEGVRGDVVCAPECYSAEMNCCSRGRNRCVSMCVCVCVCVGGNGGFNLI